MSATNKPIGYTNTLMLSSTTDGIHPHYQTNYVRPVILSGGYVRTYKMVSTSININLDGTIYTSIAKKLVIPTYSEFDIL